MPPMDRRRGPSCGTTKGPKKRRHDRTLSSRIPNHWTTLLHCVIAVCYLSCPTTSRGGVGALSITTFNILAAVHRSMPISTITTNNDGNPLEASAALPNRRESEEREWWLPRAEGLARFVAEELVRAYCRGCNSTGWDGRLVLVGELTIRLPNFLFYFIHLGTDVLRRGPVARMVVWTRISRNL